MAAVVSLALEHDVPYAFPRHVKDFPCYTEVLGLPVFSGVPTDYYNETSFYYKKLKYNGGVLCLDGYFQSYKYMEHSLEFMRTLLDIRSPEMDGCIHVRRGDYLDLTHLHPVLDMDYYNKAMSILNLNYYHVYSNDIQWCISNMGDQNYYSSLPAILDLVKMTSHTWMIIGNSSFSLMAAILNKNAEKVIAPKEWLGKSHPYYDQTKDLYKPEWILV